MANGSKNNSPWHNFEVPEDLRSKLRKDVVAKVKRRTLHRDRPLNPLEPREIQTYASEILTSDFITKYQPKGYSANDVGEYTSSDHKSLREGLSKMIAIWMEEARKRERSKDPKYTPTGQSKLDKSFPLIDKHTKTLRSSSIGGAKTRDVGSSLESIDPEHINEIENRPAFEGGQMNNAEGSNARLRRERSPTDIPYVEDEELPELADILTSTVGINKQRPVSRNIDQGVFEEIVEQDHVFRSLEAGTVQDNEGMEDTTTVDHTFVQSPITPLYTNKRKRAHSQYSIVSTDSEDSSPDSDSNIDRPSCRRRVEKMKAVENSHERARSETMTCNVSQHVEGLPKETSAELEHETAQSAASSSARATVNTPTIFLSRGYETTTLERRTTSELGGMLLEYFGTCRDNKLEAANRLPTSNQSKQMHHDAALLDHVCRDIESRVLLWTGGSEQAPRAHQITSFTLYR